MNFKLIIFDKDKTLVKPKGRGRFVNFPKDQVLLTGVEDKIQSLHDDGILMAIATNQGGVSAGHKSLGSAKAELSYAMTLTRIEYGILCPDMQGRRACALTPNGVETLSGGEANWRKPGAGMLLWCLETLGAAPRETLFVGDRPEDQQAGHSAGCQFRWAKNFFSG